MAGEGMHAVRVTSTAGHEIEFELPEDWALIVEVDGRQYVGVTMPYEDRPVEVVYWPDDDGNENVTVTPPGVPVEYYAGYPGKEGKA